MKNKTSLALLTAAASSLVQAEDKISIQYLNYQENDQRITVDDYTLTIESNPNVDHQIKVTAGFDSISGASPAWQPRVIMSAAPDSVKAASSSNIYGFDSAGYSVQNVTVPEEQRNSLGLSWLSRDKQRHELTIGLDYSEEPDYKSHSTSANYLWFADRYKNRSYSLGASLQSNQSLVFNSSYQTHWENLLASNVQFGVSQVMSQRSSIDSNLFIVYDTGYLSNHYQTILRKFDGNNDGVLESYLSAEERPESRQGGGVAGNWLVQWSNTISTHTNIRLYQDDWGIRSQTFNAKSYINLDQQWTLHLLARYYQQSAANFYKDPDSDDPNFHIIGYGSSDHRLGDYSANSFEAGIAYEWKNLIIINGQLGSYQHDTGFTANWLSTGIILKY